MSMNRFGYMLAAMCCWIMTAQAQPVFKGGAAALDQFIASKIIYPDFASANCIAADIKVSFVVNKAGKVTEAKVTQGPGIDLDEEAERVIKLTSGKWTMPSGYDHPVRLVLPIRFRPDQARCQTRQGPMMSMQEAIAAYQKRQELENAVTNYYINKYKGTADPQKEGTIMALKTQLGFDEELYKELLDRADQKYKQGDTEGACKDWKFIKNTGSDMADSFIAKYCK